MVETKVQTNSNVIPGWASRYVTTDTAKQVEAAIKAAEQSTTVEIVPIIVRRSSTIGHVPSFVGLGLLVCYFASESALLLTASLGWWPVWYLVIPIILLVLGFVIANSEFVQRIAIPPDDRAHQVNMRAEVEFFEAGLTNTRESTGVLLFISLMEHRAVVLADKAVADRLAPETWHDVVQRIVAGLKAQNLAAGLTDAISESARLVTPYFPRRADNPNELSDRLVIKE